MLIIRNGVEVYAADERTYKHHRLEELASFIPDLDEKDKVTLKLLTYFLTWAGRYPDPGSGRVQQAEDIFALSEKREINAQYLLGLVNRIMRQSGVEIERSSPDAPAS